MHVRMKGDQKVDVAAGTELAQSEGTEYLQPGNTMATAARRKLCPELV
jgi:hypothetical protein